MKILIDIGHPKNAHVLKHFVPLLEQKGHEFYFVYRDKEHTKALCRSFGFEGLDRGKGGSGIAGKFFYLLKTDYQLYRLAKKIKPDLLLSFASPYLANLSLLIKRPIIVFDDTEQNRLVQNIYSFCSDAIVVPACFGKTLSRLQFSFTGYYELTYLSPRYFQTDSSILRELGLTAGETFVLLRFVSWRAVHDISHRGLSNEEKQELAAMFSGQARVFISAEGELPHGLESLRLKTPPELIHQVMAHSALVFSEGATMAAEAAVLGVPAVHFSSLKPGYLSDLERYGLLKSFSRAENDFSAAMAHGLEILKNNEKIKKDLATKRKIMLSETIDVAAFMAWFIDRFPESVRIMTDDPQYSEQFK
jgi:predicted glycosyltransferase